MSLHSSCVWQTAAHPLDVTIKLSFNSLDRAPRTTTCVPPGRLSAPIEMCFLSHTFVKQENTYLQACQQQFPQPFGVVNTVRINNLTTSSVHPSILGPSIQPARHLFCLLSEEMDVSNHFVECWNWNTNSVAVVDQLVSVVSSNCTCCMLIDSSNVFWGFYKKDISEESKFSAVKPAVRFEMKKYLCCSIKKENGVNEKGAGEKTFQHLYVEISVGSYGRSQFSHTPACRWVHTAELDFQIAATLLFSSSLAVHKALHLQTISVPGRWGKREEW